MKKQTIEELIRGGYDPQSIINEVNAAVAKIEQEKKDKAAKQKKEHEEKVAAAFNTLINAGIVYFEAIEQRELTSAEKRLIEELMKSISISSSCNCNKKCKETTDNLFSDAEKLDRFIKDIIKF